MNTQASYSKIGAFVIVLLSALVCLILWISHGTRSEVYNRYITYAHGDITGLNVDSPVRFNGVKVGYVDGIELDRENTQLVKITIKIQQGVPIRTGTIATLLPMGVTGVLYVGLKEMRPHSALLQPNARGEYPPVAFHLSFLMQLGVLLPDLTHEMTEVSKSMRQVLSEENVRHFSAAISNIDNVTTEIKNSAKQFVSISNAVEGIVSHTEQASKDFPILMQKAKKDLDAFYLTNQSANRGIQEAMQVLKEGNLLLQTMRLQLLPVAVTTLDKVNALTEPLLHLLQETQENPAILLRGKQPSELGPGE